jgi:hypothetical protein
VTIIKLLHSYSCLANKWAKILDVRSELYKRLVFGIETRIEPQKQASRLDIADLSDNVPSYCS